MNAKEARDTAYRTNIESVHSQYADIQLKIENEANDGKYELFYYQTLIKDVHEKLVEEGFNVYESEGRMNDTLIKISW